MNEHAINMSTLASLGMLDIPASTEFDVDNVVVDDDDDDISITSTAESVQQEEYEVETIHAQEHRQDGEYYLVKWKGYPDLRCTWEPIESFNTKETLNNWRRKQQAIRKGLREPFDLVAWAAECKAFEDAREDRRRQREAKKARLRLLRSGHKEANTVPAKQQPGTPISSASQLPLSDKNTGIQSQNERSSPKTPTIENSATQVPKKTKIPTAAPPEPIPITIQAGRTERNDLSQTLNRARQQEKDHAAQNKTWKLFSTTYKFGKASREDPEPNREELELQNPKTWSPFQMTSPLRRRKPTEEDNSLFIEQDDEMEIPTSSSTAISPTHKIAEGRENSLNNSESAASKPVIPLGPRNWSFKKKRFIVKGRELNKKSDILCKLSFEFGSTAIEIGDTLLCDISDSAREAVFKLKYKNDIRIRFDEMYTLQQYKSVSDEINREVIFNGFIGAYPDTQDGLSKLEKLLLEKDLVGIVRIHPKRFISNYGMTFFCYPTNSKSFQFLNKYQYDVPEGCIRLAGRAGILPQLPQKDDLNLRYNTSPRRRDSRPEREGRFHEMNRPESENLIPWRRPSISIPPTPVPRDLALKRPSLGVRTSSLESRSQAMDSPQGVQIAQSNISIVSAGDKLEETSVTDPDMMDTTDSPVVPDTSIIGDQILGTPITEKADVAPPTDQISNEIPHVQTTEDTLGVQMAGLETGQNIETYIQNVFPKAFHINFIEIAAITSHAAAKTTNFFYLWFPESANGDLQVLEQFLESHLAIVLTNRKHNDWEKFTKSPTGVALFHHTFLQYDELPGLSKLTSNSSFNFWNVSLSEFIPNIEPKSFFQRLFPQGTGYLMTEDFMLQERDAAILILAWFRDMVGSKFPGTTKMMFRHDILKWLDCMSKEDSRFSVMALLIGETACRGNPLNWPAEARDLDCFINPYLESPVISLAEMPTETLANGASSTSNGGDSNSKPTCQERTDLLCEVFAAWAILNAPSLRRFHIITAIKPREQWQKWQHIEISQGAHEFFQRRNINKDNYKIWLAQKRAETGAETGTGSPSLSLPTEARHRSSSIHKNQLPPNTQGRVVPPSVSAHSRQP